jgi:2-iminobutanoate/2-iminopropanoate deaminase
MPRQQVSAPGTPAAVGPYSQAIAIDGFVFCSGQLGTDPATGELRDGIEAQAQQALVNMETLLGAVNLTMGDVVKTTVFMVDLADFAKMNAVYAQHVVDPAPARSTIQVAALPRGAMVEIEAVARHSS